MIQFRPSNGLVSDFLIGGRPQGLRAGKNPFPQTQNQSVRDNSNSVR